MLPVHQGNAILETHLQVPFPLTAMDGHVLSKHESISHEVINN